MGYQNESYQSLEKTLATIGEGDITVGDEETSLAGVNRDVAAVDKEIYNVDRQQGDIDLTIDHRLLSEDGHKQIAEDIKRTAILGDATEDYLGFNFSQNGTSLATGRTT